MLINEILEFGFESIGFRNFKKKFNKEMKKMFFFYCSYKGRDVFFYFKFWLKELMR